MASHLNSRYGASGQFQGEWENVETYSSVQVTLEGTYTELILRWGELRNGIVSSIFSETINQSGTGTLTMEFPIKCQWFKLEVGGTGSLNISTSYKRAPSQFTISDACCNSFFTVSGSLVNSITDISGNIMATTNNSTGTIFYTNLADDNGASLATTDRDRSIARSTISEILEFSIDSGPTNGSLVLTNNCFRLPKSLMNFRDGDIINLRMGKYIEEGYVSNGDGADNNNLHINGILWCTGRARFMVVEDDFVQFQILVNKNMSEWFDPAVGFSNSNFGEALSYEPPMEVNPNGEKYLLLLKEDGSIPTIEEYYSALHTAFGGAEDTVTLLEPGPYPVDTRFYRGSLNYLQSTVIVRITPTDPSTINSPPGGIVIDNDPTSIQEITYSISSTTDQEIVNSDYFLYSAHSDNILNHYYISSINTVGYMGSLGVTVSDTRTVTAAGVPSQYTISFTVPIKYSTVIVNLSHGTGTSSNESLAVAIANSDSNILTTYTGSRPAYPSAYLGTRNLSSILYAFDVSFTTNTTALIPAIIELSSDVSHSLVVYGNVTDNGGGNIVYSGVNSYNLSTSDYQSSNFWKLLKDYSELEQADSCLGRIFDSQLSTIVLFHQGDTSASFEERIAFDVCSNFFNGIDKIVVASPTTSSTSTAELLAFTGDSDSIFTGTLSDVTSNETFKNRLAARIFGNRYDHKNAVFITPSDARGILQASTVNAVTGAEFGEAAMFYSLSDDRGYKISSTDTDTDFSINGLYVALASKFTTEGTSEDNFNAIGSTRLLHMAITEVGTVATKTFNLEVSGSPVTTTELSDANVKLMHLSATNPTANTVWIKVYDMATNDPAPTAIAYNLAVPAQEYRDIDCGIGIRFNNGLYVGVSNSHLYDYPLEESLGNNEVVYVNGTYQIQ